MMDLGRKLWQEFIKVAANRDNLDPLLEADKRMEIQFHSSSESIRKIDSVDCWMSALHTLYDGGEVVVRNALSSLCNELEPDRLFVTCFAGKVSIAGKVLPTSRRWARDREPSPRFAGCIDDSRATEVASRRQLKPGSWSQHYHRLYTDCTDVVSFTSALTEEEQRIKEERRREAQEQERQREARRQRDRERRRRQREEQSRQRQEHPTRHRVETRERLKESQRRAEQVQQREERERQQRLQEEARQRREQERQPRQQEEARRHPEPAGAGSSRNQRSGSRNSESSNTGASGGFGRRVLQRVRAWLNPPKA